MYNLHLTPEQIEFRDTMRNFAANEIKPAAVDPQRLEPLAKPLLRDCLDKASELGLRTLLLSEEAGGVGADMMTACIVFEELAAGDVDVAVALSETALIGSLLFDRWMGKYQRENFLQRFIEENNFHLSYAGPMQVVSNGWSYYGEINRDPKVGLTALKKNQDWVIDGSISNVSNAPVAELLIIMAETIYEGNDSNGASAFIIPRNTPGLKIVEFGGNNQSSEIGWRHGCNANIEFDSCKIPLDYALDGEAKKPNLDKTYEKFTALLSASINLGLGRAAFDTAVDYAKIRRQGGRNIVEHQAIGNKIADMAIKLELASTYIYKAAWVSDHPEVATDNSVSALPHHTIASIFTAEAINEVALIAAECFGAMGVMRDMPIQKYVNDSFMFLHSDLSDIASKLPIAETVVDYQGTNPA